MDRSPKSMLALCLLCIPYTVPSTFAKIHILFCIQYLYSILFQADVYAWMFFIFLNILLNILLKSTIHFFRCKTFLIRKIYGSPLILRCVFCEWESSMCVTVRWNLAKELISSQHTDLTLQAACWPGFTIPVPANYPKERMTSAPALWPRHYRCVWNQILPDYCI